MPHGQDLVNDPVGFMRENIVIVNDSGNTAGGDQSVTNGTTAFQLVSYPAIVGFPHSGVTGTRRKQRGNMEVFELKPIASLGFLAGGGAVIDPFPITAFFCPYAAGSTFGTMVTNASRLMFTTQMDGCSFGVGSATPNGDRLVYHSNMPAVNSVAQEFAQDGALHTAFSMQNTHIQTVAAPSLYRTSRKGTLYKATTFGVADANNVWSFWTQQYTIERATPRKYAFKQLIQIL
jgi:hypothetical protein